VPESVANGTLTKLSARGTIVTIRLSSARRSGTSTVLAATLLSTALLAGACGGSPAGPPGPFAGAGTEGPDGSAAPSSSPDQIERSEILTRATTDLTAMDLIRRLRPGWLRARGRNTFGDPSSMYPVVYIDEIRHGGIGTLNGIPSSEILRMEFFNTADATTRWGTGHPSGVINLETGRQDRRPAR